MNAEKQRKQELINAIWASSWSRRGEVNEEMSLSAIEALYSEMIHYAQMLKMRDLDSKICRATKEIEESNQKLSHAKCKDKEIEL